jgi:hypothetical protein
MEIARQHRKTCRLSQAVPSKSFFGDLMGWVFVASPATQISGLEFAKA